MLPTSDILDNFTTSMTQMLNQTSALNDNKKLTNDAKSAQLLISLVYIILPIINDERVSETLAFLQQDSAVLLIILKIPLHHTSSLLFLFVKLR